MINNFDITSGKVLNVGNTYLYTLTADDHESYNSFFVTTADTIIVSDGTASVSITVSANEEVFLNISVKTITSTVDNVLVFIY